MSSFRRFWIGETTSRFGSSIGSVAVPLVALTVLHASVFMVTALTAAAWLPWVVIGLAAGAWVDRLPRRAVLIAADTVSVLSFASVPIAAWFGVLTSAQLLVVALLGGAASVFFKTAYGAFLPALLEQQQLLAGNAKLQGSEQVANVAGPGAAGLLAEAVGPTVGVLADAVSFVVSAVCLFTIRVSEPPREVRRRQLHREIAEGLALVARDPLLRVITIYGGLSNLVLVGYQAILVVFLVRIVGFSSGVTGLLLAMTSLGGVAGALLARPAARRFGSARAVLYGRLALTPAGLLIPLATKGPGLGLFMLGSVLLVGCIIAGNIVWQGWEQSYYPARLLGRISASVAVFNYGCIPLGALLSGVLASHFGVRATLWIMLIGLVLVSLVLLMSPLRRMRDLPSPQAEDVTPARSPIRHPV
jgi:predicted MFS family arabinose efflux permease